ncbi:MAG: hypothetical protein QOE11_328 [Solirubrobacteraceae bacterium]|nr:hypothetical protein [Solirubrobacteraceae bacterium]
MTIKKIVLTATAVATLAAPGIAQARQGADDPVGHVRHNGADDVRGAHHVSAKAKHRHARHARRHVRGADDAPGHVRGGADDGPNHT